MTKTDWTVERKKWGSMRGWVAWRDRGAHGVAYLRQISGGRLGEIGDLDEATFWDDQAAAERALDRHLDAATRGPGRPRTVAGEDDEERSTNAVVRLGDAHRDELDALMADHSLKDRSKAVRWLIEQSAERRARRG